MSCLPCRTRPRIYTSIDVLLELDNGTELSLRFKFIIRIFHQSSVGLSVSQVNQNLEKIRQQEGNTRVINTSQSYAIAIVIVITSKMIWHSFSSMREDTTGEVLTSQIMVRKPSGQDGILGTKKYRETSKDEVRKPWLEFLE